MVFASRISSLCTSLAELFNQSIAESVVPRQWKTSVITPIPKIYKSVNPSDFRSICHPNSVTPFAEMPRSHLQNSTPSSSCSIKFFRPVCFQTVWLNNRCSCRSLPYATCMGKGGKEEEGEGKVLT